MILTTKVSYPQCINFTLQDLIQTNLAVVDKKTNNGKNYLGTTYSSSNLGLTTTVTINAGNKLDREKELKASLNEYLATFFNLESKTNNMSNTESWLGWLKTMGKTKPHGQYLQKIYGIGIDWEFMPSRDNARVSSRYSG